MDSKYGPAATKQDTPAAALQRIHAYERVVHAANAAGEVLQAPATFLRDAQLAALFSPRVAEKLVTTPLGSGVPERGSDCRDDRASDGKKG